MKGTMCLQHTTARAILYPQGSCRATSCGLVAVTQQDLESSLAVSVGYSTLHNEAASSR